MSRVSMQAYSQRPGPTQQLGVRMSLPEPPRSKPISARSSKQGCSALVGAPSRMMSPVAPCMLVSPLPCLSHTSHSWRSFSVV